MKDLLREFEQTEHKRLEATAYARSKSHQRALDKMQGENPTNPNKPTMNYTEKLTQLDALETPKGTATAKVSNEIVVLDYTIAEAKIIEEILNDAKENALDSYTPDQNNAILLLDSLHERINAKNEANDLSLEPIAPTTVFDFGMNGKVAAIDALAKMRTVYNANGGTLNAIKMSYIDNLIKKIN